MSWAAVVALGLGAVAIAAVGWSICRAAGRMDALFDSLDEELRRREMRGVRGVGRRINPDE
jgi:hypothetical protein